ncbi:hypothetical protein QMN03_18655, partial [Leptospira santarosai]|nr:hypothetical protein [Leptospira santarosai]
MPSLKEELDIALLEKHQARHEARGMLSPPKILNTNQLTTRSVGVGYGPATVSVGISERGGTTVDLGLKSGAFNGGLSYNSKTGSVSGNVGLEIAKGSSLGISYNEGDGFGASIS